MKPADNHVEYAGFPRRALAYALDALLLFVAFPLLLGAIFYLIFYLTIGLEWTRDGFLFWAFVFCTVSLPFWLYYSLCESSPRQATIGMRVLRLRVIGVEGERINFGRALLRTVVKLLPFEINHLVMFLPTPIWNDPSQDFRVGFAVVGALIVIYLATMILTRRKQSVHDLAARTIVVQL